ncbi:hypothetical protein ACFQJC_04805 [Haloferax namakaokahaiae]|uniref:Uncharacterized protein n=1 Tax=Haloferax namakaokahaiae TaxID=1748331 RepID=A0ABD5ZC16_9EURY
MSDLIETELPVPDFLFTQIGTAKVDMELFDDDKVTYRIKQVPGGRFGIEIDARFEYAGYDCAQLVTLDREGAEALYETLGEILNADPRGDRR